MPKFLLVYRDPAPTAPPQPPSPEEMQQIMTLWNAWIDKFRKAGNLIDPGDALHPTGKVVKAGGVVTDGPFVEAKELLGGYSVIQAKSLDEAVAVAKECPAAMTPGGSIEVREFAGFA
jgi:hypothetical protein